VGQGHDLTLEERVVRLEQGVAAIIARLDGREGIPWTPPKQTPPKRPAPSLPSKSMEWWLARGGAVLTCLALVLLYQYAVERNWITPLIRVVMGAGVGAALMVAASRLSKVSKHAFEDSVGLREVLMGSALSAWYITAYAAAVSYHLISFSFARLIFLALSIGGAWLALSERRAVLAVLAVGVGFSAPLLLPAPNQSVPVFALYLGTLAAVGLIVYLMRGWQSILWLTAIAFWWSAGEATSIGSGRISMSLLVVLAAAAMIRVPLLRRKLLRVGSELYTEPAVSENTLSIAEAIALRVSHFTRREAQVDSLALWIIPISSAILALLLLSWTWTGVDGSVWGLVALIGAALAYRLAFGGRSSEEEFTHVEVTGAYVLSLAGVMWIADSLGSSSGNSPAFVLAVIALHSLSTIRLLGNTSFVAARKLAIIATGCALAAVLASETILSALQSTSYEATWTLAELSTIGVALWIWWMNRRPGKALSYPTLLGIASYAAILLIDARVLGRVWPPLVTASYAIVGTVLLIYGRERAEAVTLRRIGGATLILVVARLLMVDLARVETIWRVLLFLGCGALFLFTSHRLQTPKESQETPA
jgi:uncharacterized membrane protein